MKKVLVITTSLREKSNSDMLADAFIEGAKIAGNLVEKITLKNKLISFCRGCLTCQKTGKCVIEDDANAIVEKMKQADILVFATPIYYYEMSGQLKTLLDRANPLYTSDYMFKEIYMLMTAAEEEDHTSKIAVSGLQGWIECFENAKFAGAVFAGGATNAGDVEGHSALEKAYQMGKLI